MSVDDTTWSEIRRCYEAGTESAAAIARRFSISAERIYRRARREGWARKGSASGPAPRKPESAPGKARKTSRTRADKPTAEPERPGGKAPMVDRLYRAIDVKLTRLEARMRAHQETSAADSEREARELASMIRSFEQVSELKANIAERGARHGEKASTVSPADAERMRTEIAERLERLFGGRQSGARPGGAE